MNYYRGLEPYPANRFFFGAPLLGGFVGGLLGGGLAAAAFYRPRPFYPYPPPMPYYPYPGPPPIPYGYGPYGY